MKGSVFLKNQFSRRCNFEYMALLQYIQPKITQEENAFVKILPNEEEINKVVFALNPDSACGPNGLKGCFYQTCWDIVGPDIIKVIHAFF